MKKQDFTAKILQNTAVAHNFYKMTLESKGVLFAPGEFFQLSVPGHTLRRPFAPSHSDRNEFAFTYQLVGSGTEKLSSLSPGTELSVIAPLGTGFTLPQSKSCAVLVGGGCGTPSLVLLATELQTRNIPTYTVIGARSACSLLEAESLNYLSERLVITTDDGSEGIKGNTVEGVRSILPEIKERTDDIRLFSCGPVPMLQGLAELAAAEGFTAELSFEERMACGFGACMGCAIRINAPETAEGFVYKRVCQDGPVFDSREIYWN